MSQCAGETLDMENDGWADHSDFEYVQEETEE